MSHGTCLTICTTWSHFNHHPTLCFSFHLFPYFSSLPAPAFPPSSQTPLTYRLQFNEAAISSPHHPLMLCLQEMMMYGLVVFIRPLVLKKKEKNITYFCYMTTHIYIQIIIFFYSFCYCFIIITVKIASSPFPVQSSFTQYRYIAVFLL